MLHVPYQKKLKNKFGYLERMVSDGLRVNWAYTVSSDEEKYTIDDKN